MWELLATIWVWIVGIAIMAIICLIFVAFLVWTAKDTAQELGTKEGRQAWGCILALIAFLALGLLFGYMATRNDDMLTCIGMC